MISIALRQPIRHILQHYMNSLNIYSFVCRLRISKGKALKTAQAYERVVHPLLYFKKEDKLCHYKLSKKVCPFVKEPIGDYYCFKMGSRDIMKIFYYGKDNFETCDMYMTRYFKNNKVRF
jgi:hypothetical protein